MAFLAGSRLSSFGGVRSRVLNGFARKVGGVAHGVLLQLAAILVSGVLAQWVAWRLRLPSILLLLLVGTLAGPVTGLLDPDRLFGDLMLPLVSLSVAVILYEGGLNLRFRELRQVGGVFLLLTTVGAATTWLIASAAAYGILGYTAPVAALLGAILIVTGPTVIGPILRHLRMRGKVGALLKWEGIIIDPLGATAAVLVFTVIQAGANSEGYVEATFDLVRTLVAGVVIGGAAAAGLTLCLARFWIPDALHNPVSLMLVFVAFTAGNLVQEESGLLAVTVMGMALANQKWASIRHVVAFKETLTILLISCLFIVLSARLQPASLAGLGWKESAFTAVLIVAARPAAVLLSTWGSSLTRAERCFLAAMAPRGIVAAAIASVFALSLAAEGYAAAADIVPVTFLVVLVTVALYGLGAGPLARRLGLVQADPQGVLFVGAEAWVRAVAAALHKEGCPVLLIDTDWGNVRHCRMAGLPCLYGSALAAVTREEIDYTGLGRMLAVTPNNEVNTLACRHYAEDFGRQGVFQLAIAGSEEGKHEAVSAEHRGRPLFAADLTFDALSELAGRNPQLRKTKLTEEFDYEDYGAEYGDSVRPLFLLKPDGAVKIFTAVDPPTPKPGDAVLGLVRG